MRVIRPRDRILAELEAVRRMHQIAAGSSPHLLLECHAFREVERRLLRLDADRRRS